MKIRIGFVSNSSSSSFCIYGICMDKYDLEEFLKDKGISEEYLGDIVYDYLDEWCFIYNLKKKGMSEEDAQQEADKRVIIGFDIHSPSEDDSVYIGRAWSGIGDDETGSQFKQKIETELKVTLGEDIKCGTFEEAWREG